MSEEILRLEHISKSFRTPDEPLEILSDVSISILGGESISVMGKSGSGKSTLLSIAALIEPPTSGKVFFHGNDVTGASDKEKARLRRDELGFVFQNSLLLEDFSALENVALPLMNKGIGKKEAYGKAESILSTFGLSERLRHRPSELSGGERQRVAISRALAPSPSLIFCDEPTGSLDEESALAVEDLLFEKVSEFSVSIVLVTHNPNFASRASRRFVLSHKELVSAEE